MFMLQGSQAPLGFQSDALSRYWSSKKSRMGEILETFQGFHSWEIRIARSTPRPAGLIAVGRLRLHWNDIIMEEVGYWRPEKRRLTLSRAEKRCDFSSRWAFAYWDFYFHCDGPVSSGRRHWCRYPLSLVVSLNYVSCSQRGICVPDVSREK